MEDIVNSLFPEHESRPKEDTEEVPAEEIPLFSEMELSVPTVL